MVGATTDVPLRAESWKLFILAPRTTSRSARTREVESGVILDKKDYQMLVTV